MSLVLRYRDEFFARRFSFDEPSHVYSLDDAEVFSTSNVVRAWHRLCGKEMPAFTDEQRDRGHALHEAIEADILGRLDELHFEPEVWKLVEPKLEANRGWRRISGFEPAEIEQPDGSLELALEVRMWHPSGVGGTADALGLVYDRRAVVDWKSTYTDGVEIQTAGYETMAQFAFDFHAERRWSIGHSLREGKGFFSPKEHSNPLDRRTFAGTLWLMHEAVRRKEFKHAA